MAKVMKIFDEVAFIPTKREWEKLYDAYFTVLVEMVNKDSGCGIENAEDAVGEAFRAYTAPNEKCRIDKELVPMTEKEWKKAVYAKARSRLWKLLKKGMDWTPTAEGKVLTEEEEKRGKRVKKYGEEEEDRMMRYDFRDDMDSDLLLKEISKGFDRVAKGKSADERRIMEKMILEGTTAAEMASEGCEVAQATLRQQVSRFRKALQRELLSNPIVCEWRREHQLAVAA